MHGTQVTPLLQGLVPVAEGTPRRFMIANKLFEFPDTSTRLPDGNFSMASASGPVASSDGEASPMIWPSMVEPNDGNSWTSSP